MTMTRVIVTCI